MQRLSLSPAEQEQLQQLRQEVCAANRALPARGLVAMHSGNVSGLMRAAGVVVIKPSGIDYETLTPDLLVATDLAGAPMNTGCAGDQLHPSVDLRHHLYLYRAWSDVGGIVHTHSNYATSFAAVGRGLPAYLTAIADEFGGEIPCAPYVDNQQDHIGEAIVQNRGRSPSILLAQHGTFSWGRTPNEALKAAVMLEDVAKTCHLALRLGQPTVLSEEEIGKWYARYHGAYGQTRTRSVLAAE